MGKTLFFVVSVRILTKVTQVTVSKLGIHYLGANHNEMSRIFHDTIKNAFEL